MGMASAKPKLTKKRKKGALAKRRLSDDGEWGMEKILHSTWVIAELKVLHFSFNYVFHSSFQIFLLTLQSNSISI